jgi:hypothetical protein
MAGRLSAQYRYVVRKSTDTYADKPVAENIVTQKRAAIREVRAEVTKAGIGAHGAVYAGAKLNTLVYQVRNTYADDGAAGKLVIEEL